MALPDAPRVPEMPDVGNPSSYTTESDGVKISRRGDRAVVDFAPGAARMSRDSGGHSENLLKTMDDKEQVKLAEDVIEWVEVDLDARADWDRRMDQAMELLGLNNIPLEELPFDGASAVTYPLIGEAVVQFQSRAIEEVFPSEGPVKVKVVGSQTQEKWDQAERVKNHMNYQILDEDRSFFWQADTMLFYLPLGGSAFKKTYHDDTIGMVTSRFITSKDFIVPYGATDLASAPRYTHRMRKTYSQMKKLFASGFYEEIDLPKISALAQASESADDREIEDKSDDTQPSVHQDDAEYTVLECHCDLDILDAEEDGIPRPYVVSVERETRKLLSVRRNWKEEDPLFIKRLYFTHYKYLPGLGFYGFGLLHLIGSLAEATTGAVRALLDSAAFANMQGGFVSSDAKIPRGENHVTAGEYKDVNMTAEELARGFYTPPFKEPSQALVNMLQMLIDAGKAFTSATEVLTGEASNTGPVGTTIALIEQGSKPFSAIHRRLHMAAAEEFALRAELNFEFLPDHHIYREEDDSGFVEREDYDGRVDVIPVSDPNIFSTVQRIAQGQAMVQLAAENPDIYNRMAVHERFLQAMRVPDHEELLQKREPLRQDPITENFGLLQGQPANAFIEQDHDAHIQVHINFINGLAPEALEELGPIMQAHLAEHYAFKYFNEMNRMMGGELPPPGTFTTQQPIDPEMENQIAQIAAQLPEIQIMEHSITDLSEGAFQSEEARKDEAAINEIRRKDEAALADIRRKDLDALEGAERDEAVAAHQARLDDAEAKAKQKREDAAAEAKLRNEERLSKAKAANIRKQPKPRATSK